ncbi:MAG: HAD family hydrolase [Armatimonadota bacterium]|jgi:putative hydrolase of the HAD superfamily
MPVKALLLDIGEVLLTKGWGRHTRQKAAEHFGLDYDEMQDRHALIFHIYEEGRISLDEYLKRVIFHCPRSFTYQQFTDFMYEQSKPYPDMMEFVSVLKAKYGLKTVALSNEGREITEYRIEKFDLASLIDFFVCSCYVGTEKPDPAIFGFAMDQVQLCREEVVYIDDTELHVEVARELGIPAIKHVDYASTREKLVSFGLELK